MTRSIGILGYEGVEVLDFAGPYEVFTTADRVAHKVGLPNQFTVLSLATTEIFTARAGLQIKADFLIQDSPKLDVLIIPGGVTTEPESNEELIHWLRRTFQSLEVVASVCTGIFILAQAELVKNEVVTTHWEDLDDLKNRFPNLQVKPDVRWVDSGKVISSAGISAGIDMSLYLVGKLASQDLARKTAKQMDYPWQE